METLAKRIKFPGHLHVHSEYSMLDGLGSINEYARKCKELGYEFMAITEHGNMFSIYEASEIEDEYGIHIIKGCEFYTQEYSDYKTGHLILLAKNEEGLKDLFELNAKACDNFYYKPRVSPAQLRSVAARGNVVCLTACIANHIHQAIKKDRMDDALREHDFLVEIFGDDVYFEIQTSTKKEEIEAYRKFIDRFPYEKFVLTGDVHYPEKEDQLVHDVLLSINTKVKMNSPKKMRMEDTYHMMSDDELFKRFMDNFNDVQLWTDCCWNVAEVFAKCNSKVQIKREKNLPVYEELTNEEATEELKKLVNEGVKNKLIPNGEYNEDFKNDLIHEVDVISSEGYSGYFLIVNEYCNWARNNNIKVGDGRGSGAGSKVAYTIGITDVNPQKYDLLFERFLARGRQPDFDVDFSDIEAVFKHLQEKYGRTNVARVGAFTTFSDTTAIQKVLSAYGISYTETRKCMENPSYYKAFAEKNKDIAFVVNRLIGKIDHMSTHAGGVVIAKDLIKKLPVFVRAGDKDKLIIGLDKKPIEALGYYKFDVLGLSGLEVIAQIEEDITVDWKKVDFNDEKIYDMLCNGEVNGVFQLAGQRDKVLEQQPKCFEDLIALNALIRPGVCDWKVYLAARAKPPREVLPFMECTHGLIVYQEQYEQLAQHYCGWSIAYGDKHLRKNKDILNDINLRKKFFNDGIDKGSTSFEHLEILWNQIIDVVSKGYSFNKSHATAYAVLSFKTAYYKLYHKEAFYSAILTKDMNIPERVAHHINVAKNNGIEFLPPSLSNITTRYSPAGKGKIQIPMTALKGVGANTIEHLQKLYPIKNITDLMERRNKSKLKKNHLEVMIRAGMFSGKKEELFNIIGSEYEELPKYKEEFNCYGFYINHSPFSEIYNKKIQKGKFRSAMQISKITKKKDRSGKEYAFVHLFNAEDSFEGICFSSIWKDMNVHDGDVVIVMGEFDGNKAIIKEMKEVYL